MTFEKTTCLTIMCRNDELSWLLALGYLLFILFSENSQILLKISVIPILLTFIYLVHCKFLSHKSYGKPVLQKVPFNMHVNLTGNLKYIP